MEERQRSSVPRICSRRWIGVPSKTAGIALWSAIPVLHLHRCCYRSSFRLCGRKFSRCHWPPGPCYLGGNGELLLVALPDLFTPRPASAGCRTPSLHVRVVGLLRKGLLETPLVPWDQPAPV